MESKVKYHVPDIFAPKKLKESRKFATNVARYILGATSAYRAKMAGKYANNRDIFNGKQSLKYLRDLLQVEENATWFNIKFTPRPIAKKIIRLVVSGYMQDEEAVNASALSKHIQDRRDRTRLQAKYRMENKELLDELSNLAGLPLVTSENYTPETEEELELHTAMNDKEREETLMQDTLTYILNANDIDKIKQLALTELAINNLFGVYEYVDSRGKPKMEPIYAEDAIIPTSYYEDFSDGPFFGRYIEMHVADVRRRFNIRQEDEKEFYKALTEAHRERFLGTYGEFNSKWNVPGERPYDKDTVRVLHVWWKCAKVYETVEGTKDGKEYLDSWDYEGYTPTDRIAGIEGLKIDYKTPPTAYEGFFLNGGDFVLEWKEQDSIPYDDKDQEVRSPFRFIMPENSGTMDVNSMVYMMKDSIETMDLVILKIKQLIAKLPPDGWAIDIDSLEEMDLGTGSILSPLDVKEIATQTGDLFYRGKDEDGNPNQLPMRPNVTTISEKLNSLIATYNFELENIRNYLGINEFRDGSANKSRTAAAFAQSQLEQSNMATDFVFRSWNRLMTGVVKNLGLRTWYALKYGKKDKGLLRYLGTSNVEFLESQEELIETAFDFEYRVVMTREEKLLLEQTMQSAVSEGSLLTEDVILIRQVRNSQVALKYLNFLSKKRRKERMEEARENQESAANYTAEAGVRVERAKQETVDMAAKLEMAKEKERGNNAVETEMTKGAMSIILQYAKENKPVPEEYQFLLQYVLNSATVKMEKSTRETSRDLEQMDAEDELMAAQAQLEQAVQNGELPPEQLEEAIM